MKKLIIKNHYYQLVILCFTIVVLSSCTKNFLEYNTNPLLVTEEELEKDNLRTGGFFLLMQKSVIPVDVHSFQRGQNLIGDVYAGYMGVTKDWDASRNTTTYVFKPDWIVEPFNDAFLRLLPAWQMVRKTPNVKEDIFALAQIIKISAIHRTTDIYGPLPYSTFGEKNDGNIVYDSQEDIYYSFFSELDSAITALTNYNMSNPTAQPLRAYDLIYDGDYSKWIRYANTLKLRLALRIVYVDPTNAKKYAEEAVNHPYGVLTSSTEHDALLKSIAGVDIQNPLDIICNTYNDIRMGAYMQAVLEGYKDPRLKSWFIQSKAKVTDQNSAYYGIRNGIVIDDPLKYRSFSPLQVTARTPIVWMTAAEAYFLRAEGAIRGWNMMGTAKELYESGIRESFKQNQASGVEDYIKDNTSIPNEYNDPLDESFTVPNNSYVSRPITVAWNDATNFETKLEKIITQKWIALYPNGQEAWTEFRRTGYPRIFPVVYNFNNTTISTSRHVRRIPFPFTEYKNNPKGVESGIKHLGGVDHGGIQLWWDKK